MTRARLASFGGGLLLAVMAAAAVHAANELPTNLSIRPLEEVTIGEWPTVVVSLTLENGTPIADGVITLTVEGIGPRRERTDSNGLATFRLTRDLPPGEYAVLARYAGQTDAYLGATAPETLTIVPFELAIETVPPLPGMVFALDGEQFTAGEDGMARHSVNVRGVHELTALEGEYQHSDQHVEFSRWSTEEFGPVILIQIPRRDALQAGFDVSYRASQTFVDSEGGTVNPERITSLTLRNSLGTVLTYPDADERWYKTSRVVRRPTGLQSVPVHYTLDAVVVDGANVVNTGQERFDVSPNDIWKIELLLFSARMLPTDALLGFPIGDAVNVTYPDGREVRVEAEANGEIWARWLARGQYRVTVADAPGWAPVMPVALSRDQEVELRVISYLDMAAAVFSAVGLAVGLLHIGRPHLVPQAVSAAGGSVANLMRRSRRRASAPSRMMARPTTAPMAAQPDRSSPTAANPRERVPLLPGLLPVQTVVVRTPNPSLATAVSIVPPAPPAPPPAEPASAAEPRSPAEASLARPDLAGVQRDAAAGATPTRRRPKEVSAVSDSGAGSPTPEVGAAAATATEGPPTVAVASSAAEKPATATRAKAARKPRATRAKPNSAAAADTAKPVAKKARKATKPKPSARPSKAAASPRPRAGVKAHRGETPSASESTAGRQANAAGVRTTRAGKGTSSTSARKARTTKHNGRAPARAAAKRARAATARTGDRRTAKARTPGRDTRTRLIPVPMTLSEERAILEQRRLQLVSLGLDDPAETAVVDPADDQSSASDTVVRGAPPMEIGICAGCGLTLWAGAKFCRRCGRFQEPPASVGPGVVPASTADGEAPNRARRGAAS